MFEVVEIDENKIIEIDRKVCRDIVQENFNYYRVYMKIED